MGWRFYAACVWHGFSQFVLTAGGTLSGGMVAEGGGVHYPGGPVWLLAGIWGMIAAVKGIDSYLATPNRVGT
jgi:hypothetical protein